MVSGPSLVGRAVSQLPGIMRLYLSYTPHRTGLSLGLNVKKESLLKCLMDMPRRGFALCYEKTISWPERGLFTIFVGDSDPTFCDSAILGEWID